MFHKERPVTQHWTGQALQHFQPSCQMIKTVTLCLVVWEIDFIIHILTAVSKREPLLIKGQQYSQS